MEKFTQINQYLIEHGSISTKEAEELGIHRSTLAKWSKEEKIERLARGIYGLPTEIPDFLYNFQKRCKKAIYSHETALYIHGFSDRTPLTHTATVPKGYNVHRYGNEPVKFRYIETKYYELGITEMKSSHGNPIRVYNLERTICDIIKHRNKIDPAILNTALREYASSPRAKLSILDIYAHKMGLKTVLKNVMGVLL